MGHSGGHGADQESDKILLQAEGIPFFFESCNQGEGGLLPRLGGEIRVGGDQTGHAPGLREVRRDIGDLHPGQGGHQGAG